MPENIEYTATFNRTSYILSLNVNSNEPIDEKVNKSIKELMNNNVSLHIEAESSLLSP